MDMELLIVIILYLIFNLHIGTIWYNGTDEIQGGIHMSVELVKTFIGRVKTDEKVVQKTMAETNAGGRMALCIQRGFIL